MPYALDDLGRAVTGQLYDVACGCDRSVPPARDSFLTWCQPGIPFRAADLDFAGGELGAGSVDDAFAFSRLVDFVPAAQTAYTHDRQQRCFTPDAGGRLSTVYGDVLRSARVVHSGLSDDEQGRVERLGGLLRTTRTVLDVATGEPRRITDDGPMLKAYNEKLAAYLAAVLRCNGGRVAARGGARLDWAGNAERYRTQVESGMADWISVGYRNEVDQIDAYIDQATGRDLVHWRRALVDMLDGAVLQAGGQCRRFHHTVPVPSGFAGGDGWTRHTFTHHAIDSGAHQEPRSWRAGGPLNFELAAFGDGTTAPASDGGTVESFELHLELRPVLISRPWFYPPLLRNRGWTCDQQLSDGGDPPAGSLIGYPSTILFARDIRIESADFAAAYARFARSVGDSAGIGWGPFWLGGRHRRGGRELQLAASVDARGVSIPELQIFGFVNQQLGKTPNPLPGLDQGRFV